MKLIHRFAYFGVGLIISSVFVYFVWEKKGASFDYLPNARVLKNIQNNAREFSPEALEKMILIGIDSADINTILQYGDVDFKKSSPREKPCKIFFVNGKQKQKNITLVIKKCDTISTIYQVILN